MARTPEALTEGEKNTWKNRAVPAPTTITVKKNKTSRRKIFVVRSSETFSFSNSSYCSLLTNLSPAHSFRNFRARKVSSLAAL